MTDLETDLRRVMRGEVRFDRRMASRIPDSGGIALAAYTGGVGECTVFYDNVVVTSLDGR